MMKIAITRLDGGVSIMTIIGDATATAAVLNKWQRSHPGEYVRHTSILDSALPTDRSFREAWEHNDGAIAVNMTKAREIHKGRLRLVRAPLLTALDIEYQRADERGDAAAKIAIASKKQELRDVTGDPRIKAAATPSELTKAIPAILL